MHVFENSLHINTQCAWSKKDCTYF